MDSQKHCVYETSQPCSTPKIDVTG